MKLAIYLTKSKLWHSGQMIEWTEDKLVEIFKSIRSDEHVKDVRIVLGNDVSYVASFEAKEIDSREKIAIKTKEWVPFEFDNDCFDYKVINIGNKKYIQSVAIERSFLKTISSAVWESGLSLEIMIPIGVLLGEKTLGNGELNLVKWNRYETLSVLAILGITESVFENESDENIFNYAKKKWNIATDLKIMNLDDSNFNLSEAVFSERERGGDGDILSIPVLKKQDLTSTPLMVGETENIVVEKESKRVSKTTIVLIIILVISLVILFWLYRTMGVIKTP